MLTLTYKACAHNKQGLFEAGTREKRNKFYNIYI